MNCCGAGSPSKTELDKTRLSRRQAHCPAGHQMTSTSWSPPGWYCEFCAVENQKMEKEMKEKLYRQRKELRRIEEKEKSLQEQTVQIKQEAVITSKEILETGRSMSK